MTNVEPESLSCGIKVFELTILANLSYDSYYKIISKNLKIVVS